VGLPFVFQQHSTAGLELAFARTAQHDLVVEGHDQVSLVAAVGNTPRGQPDAVAAGALDAACRRLDLGRYDFDRPDADAHARGDGAERLAALLRTLAGIADDLDGVLVDHQRRAGLDPFRGLAHFQVERVLVLSRLCHVCPVCGRSGPCPRCFPNKVRSYRVLILTKFRSCFGMPNMQLSRSARRSW
jgi:hypothetical protein